jgi:DNA polymerase III sliding clamp (beta) subunit (PCNA family)
MNTTIEMVHPEKYANSIKIAQKFTSKSGLRLALQLVCHRENGDLIATDSHQLIRVKQAHGFTEEYLVNTKSLEFAKGTYPDIDRTIPTEHKTIIRLNKDQIRIWLQMHKSMNQMTKLKAVQDSLTMNLTNDSISFEFRNRNISFQLPFEEMDSSPDIRAITYQVEYMKNALEAHFLLNSQEVYISLSSPLRPILLDNQNDVQAVVLPVRIY